VGVGKGKKKKGKVVKWQIRREKQSVVVKGGKGGVVLGMGRGRRRGGKTGSREGGKESGGLSTEGIKGRGVRR